MEKATISELKNRLSAYLKKVRAGQAILILERDQPIARLERVEGEAQGDERLVCLERAGLVRRAKSPPPLKALRAAAPKAKQSVSEAVLDERRDGR